MRGITDSACVVTRVVVLELSSKQCLFMTLQPLAEGKRRRVCKLKVYLIVAAGPTVPWILLGYSQHSYFSVAGPSPQPWLSLCILSSSSCRPWWQASRWLLLEVQLQIGICNMSVAAIGPEMTLFYTLFDVNNTAQCFKCRSGP